MSYGNQPINEFLTHIASEHITPAGGSTAAVVGAMGAALGEMACIHTLTSEADRGIEADVSELRAEFSNRQARLLDLAAKDADVVDEVYTGSSQSVSEQESRRLLGVPLSIAEACLGIVEQSAGLTDTIGQDVAPDGWIGIWLAHSALKASIFIVRSNLDLVSDSTFAEQMERRCTEMEEAADDAFANLPNFFHAKNRGPGAPP